ncbi:MAG: carboxypeptidase-like regulatory domain-containing protein, partial [Mucilaginibacter sp.]
MKTHHFYNIFKSTLILLFLTLSTTLMAQQTIIKGVVTDIRTQETMPAVSISFDGTSIGGSTDVKGNYKISTDGNYNRIKVTFIGYKTFYKDITPGTAQTINIALAEDRTTLSEVVVKSGKKTRYTNKNNPAVELIRKVIAHKDQNRLENFDYAEYQQYERMIFSLSDLSEKFKQKRIFKNYQFLFMEQDSNAIGGKNLLPMYMEEKLSDNYFRKSPYVKKQVIQANKQVKYDENFIDNEGLKAYFNRMYMDIEIYDNNIPLLGNQLLSPIANGAPSFYKFFITDTVKD